MLRYDELSHVVAATTKIVYMSGLLFENNKHTIAKVRENANRHGNKMTQ